MLAGKQFAKVCLLQKARLAPIQSLRGSTAQHSTAQHSTAQHSTAQHSTAQHSTAQHGTAQHSCYSVQERHASCVKQTN